MSLLAAMVGLPAAAELFLAGLACGAASMLLYWWLSPQQRLKEIAQQGVAARREMNAYQGDDFAVVWQLARRSLGYSLRQVAFVVGPTLLAALPIVWAGAWLDAWYGYALPAPGEKVAARVNVTQPNSLAWVDADGRREPIEFTGQQQVVTTHVAWPNAAAGQTVLLAAAGKKVLQLSAQPIPVFSQPTVWDLLGLGPAHHLPAESPVSRVELALPAAEVWAVGPLWLRAWWVPFVGGLFLAALSLKLSLGIQ